MKQFCEGNSPLVNELGAKVLLFYEMGKEMGNKKVALFAEGHFITKFFQISTLELTPKVCWK